MSKCLHCNKSCSATYCCLSCSNFDRRRKNKLKYDLNPTKFCPVCQVPIPYEKKNINTYCSHSCAASYNNTMSPKRKKILKNKPKPLTKLEEFNQGLVRTRKTLKELLISQKGEICSICGFSGKWNHRPITLVLDHINGDASIFPQI